MLGSIDGLNLIVWSARAEGGGIQSHFWPVFTANATATSGATTITLPAYSYGIIPGMVIGCAGIPSGTTIVGPTPPNQPLYAPIVYTISAPTTAALTAESCTFTIGSQTVGLYPGALVSKVVGATNDTTDNNFALAPNNTAWTTGANVEESMYPAQNTFGIKTSISQYNSPHSFGLQAVAVGILKGWERQDIGFQINNLQPVTNYSGYGGTITPPASAFSAQGTWQAALGVGPGIPNIIDFGCPYNTLGAVDCTVAETIINPLNSTNFYLPSLDTLKYTQTSNFGTGGDYAWYFGAYNPSHPRIHMNQYGIQMDQTDIETYPHYSLVPYYPYSTYYFGLGFLADGVTSIMGYQPTYSDSGVELFTDAGPNNAGTPTNGFLSIDRHYIQTRGNACFTFANSTTDSGDPATFPTPYTGICQSGGLIYTFASPPTSDSSFNLATTGMVHAAITAAGGGGVTSVNGNPGALVLSFSAGAGSCSYSSPTTTCTFSGSGSGGGSVTNFIAATGSWPSWIVPSVATSTTTPTLSVAAGTGLTTHQVLGTGTSGTLGLETLANADLPSTLSAPTTGTAAGITSNGSSDQVWSMNSGATAQAWQTITGNFFATQNANYVFAGPASGGAANPGFRSLVSADIPNNAANTSGTAANLSGTPALPNGTTATTQTAGDVSGKLATDLFVANYLPQVTTFTTATFSFGGTYNSGFYYNENTTAATAVTGTLPTPVKGMQYCVKNFNNGTAPTTGTIEVIVNNTSTQQIVQLGTASTSGYVISSGAAGDAACFVAVSTTQWDFVAQAGTWTLH